MAQPAGTPGRRTNFETVGTQLRLWRSFRRDSVLAGTVKPKTGGREFCSPKCRYPDMRRSNPTCEAPGTLTLCGAGAWLAEKHGTKTRRAWRKLHRGPDANTGEILATALTTNDADDASQTGPCWTRWKGLWSRSPAMAPTTRTASIALSSTTPLMLR